MAPAAGERHAGEAPAQRLVGEHGAPPAVDDRIVVGPRHRLSGLLEDCTEKPEPRV